MERRFSTCLVFENDSSPPGGPSCHLHVMCSRYVFVTVMDGFTLIPLVVYCDFVLLNSASPSLDVHWMEVMNSTWAFAKLQRADAELMAGFGQFVSTQGRPQSPFPVDSLYFLSWFPQAPRILSLNTTDLGALM